MSDIHSTAVIAPGAEIGDDVTIGPYCVIGPDAKIGNGVVLFSHVVVDGHTTVGKGCRIHPFARIGGPTQDLKYNGGTTYVEIGEDTVLRECVTVNCGTRDGEVTKVGSGCLLMAYCHVAHGCNLGNGIIVSNGTQFAGEVTIEDKATISGLVAVHQFVRIGTMCMVGGALKVAQDIPPYMTVDGVDGRARAVGINNVGLTRRGFSEETRNALRQAHRMICHSDMNVSDSLARVEAELPDIPEIRHLVDFFRTTKRGVIR